MGLSETWAKLDGFLQFYSVGTAYTLKQLFSWTVKRDVKRPENFTLGQTGQPPFPWALITGGTKGLGLALAKLLVKQRFGIILVARNKVDGENAVRTLKSIDDVQCPVHFYSVDLSDLEQLKTFTAEISSKYDKLHLLVNNAGLMMTPYTIVQNGRFELQWATNLVATVFLSESLLPLLKKGSREDGLGRVINLSSSGMFSHNLTESYWKNMPCSEAQYSSHFAYSNSKFAIAMYTYDLQERVDKETEQGSKVTTYSLHPGIISTDLFQHLSIAMRGFFVLSKVLYRSAEGAAWDMLYLCLEDQSKLQPGQCYENTAVRPMAQVDSQTREAFKAYIDKLRGSF